MLLQDVTLADGRTWSELLADKLAPVAAGEGLVGSHGYSSLGAVVGATYPRELLDLQSSPRVTPASEAPTDHGVLPRCAATRGAPPASGALTSFGETLRGMIAVRDAIGAEQR